jgi:hypothetical protein
MLLIQNQKPLKKLSGSQYSGRKALVILAGNFQSDILWIRNQNPLSKKKIGHFGGMSFWREIVSPTFCGLETRTGF